MNRIQNLFAAAVIAGACVSALQAEQVARGAMPSVDAMLGAAMHQQEVEGDLQAAATTYKKVLADPRATAEIRAKAQAQLNRIEEQLAGRTSVTVPTKTAPISSRVYSHRNTNIGFGVPSRDGRYLPMVQFEAGGDLYVRTVATGEMRQLTQAGTLGVNNRPEYAGKAVFTADGRRLAFAWKKATGYELHLIDSDGRNQRVVSSNPEHEWLGPVAWAADGARVLVTINVKGNVGQIAWMSVADGEIQVLKTMPWSSLGTVSLSPDGRHVVYDAADAEPGRRTVFLLSADAAMQVALSDGTSRNEVVGWSPDGQLVMFATNRSGADELWAVNVANGTPSGSPHLVKREFAGVRPLGITAAGTLFYATVATTGAAYVANVDWESGTVTGEKKISGNVVVDFGADWSPDGESIAYVAHRGSTLDRRFIGVYSVTTNTHREVAPPEDFHVFVNGGNLWSPDGKSFLVTGGNSTIRQGAFAVDMTTGQTRLLVSRPGAQIQIPSWTSDGKGLLYRLRDQFKPRSLTFIRNLEDGTDRQITHGMEDAQHVSFSASPDGRMLALHPASPDMKPSLNVVPVDGGEPRRLFEPPPDHVLWTVGWTRDSQRVIFWTRRQGQPGSTQMWTIPVAGAAPTRLQLPNAVTEVRVHPDGRQVVYSITHMHQEVWTMQNLTAAATVSSR